MNPTDAPHSIPSPAQCRAARSVLGLTVLNVVAEVDVSSKTLVKLEAGGEVRAAIADRLRAAFEARGVAFAPDGKGLSW